MYVVQITLVLLLAACSNALNEPQCSRFEYDVQTLKAMLKVENKVDIFEEKLQNWEKILETKLDKFNEAEEKRVEELRRMQTETENRATKFQNKLENRTNAFQKEIEDRTNTMETKLGDSQQKFATKLHGDVMSMMSHMNSTMDAFVKQQVTLSKNRGQQVAFTAHGSSGKLIKSVLTFKNVILNKGGAYDQTTGKFTCPVAGTYLFSATLLSVVARSDRMYCWIRKNGTDVALVYSHEGTFDSASVSVIFHLSVGDLVDLGSCVNVNYILTSGGHSSFIGSLIQAD